jgi:predicted amidohydrolase YtcJ
MKTADLILKSNAVFTGIDERPFAGAVFIKGNKIIGVKKGTELDEFVGAETKVLEYGDKLIMPGFVDAHVHYFMGAISASEHMCTEISESTSESECVNMVKKFAEEHPEEKRIIGIGWFPANWGGATLPTKNLLDSVIPDKPVYLICADVHTFWMNSMALEEAGITADMKLKSGEIGKFENGELNGLLFEPGAFEPAMSKVLDLDKEVMKDVHRKFLAHIAANGVTSISEMSADDYNEVTCNNYEVVKEMEEAGELTSRLHIYTRLEGYIDFSKAKELQKKYDSQKLRVNGVKGFVDGVTSTFTGLLLEPYSDNTNTLGIGVPNTPKEEMQRYIIAANAAGLPVRLHCIGDGAVRMALDMYEASIIANGRHELKNTIEHIESIHPDDIPRFAKLDVVPSMQPYHLTLDFNEKLGRIGTERCRWEWPHKTILEKGGKLAFGTDYPVVDFNPFPSIYAAVTRCDDEGKPTGTNPEECISLADALKAYTAGAANAYGRMEDLGTLEVGKLADIIVVNNNLFNVDKNEIQNCSVELTVMDGKIVYKKNTQ